MDYIKHIRSIIGQEKIIMVVAGSFVFDKENRLLLQCRSDTASWGLPGGFMELDETVHDTARREVYEETGLHLGKMDLFGIYSGPNYDKTFPNGDEVSMVQVIFTCNEFSGELVKQNEESLKNKFFSLDKLPNNLFIDHKVFFADFLSQKERPIIG
ncbi:NUDIX hydrolase [Lederbergia lenta]|uniref:Putative MutT/Nudix family protein n=1 Tax=Lederbergia lenta TaxID=1467 RepID=A0A2X4W6T0_LEDLE|nr:NUDIX hydrolase [Lederbergia lenta]MEC2324663.1 NUDIX hydrolase [Lederbergia lenta]SQI58713.1 putative MutT/Nudix family protein [Lederbergia lenta]